MGKNEYGPVFSALKHAAEVEKIQARIEEGDNKQAFSFIAQRLDELETAIKKKSSYNLILPGNHNPLYTTFMKENLEKNNIDEMSDK